jgi:hypothetical protein
MTQNISAITPYGLRLPAPLKRAVKKAAKGNGRSMNSEIIYQLERVYCAPEAAGSSIGPSDPAASSNIAA